MTKASGPTAKRMNLSLAQAEIYVRKTVLMMKATDFVESALMSDVWFDVYALYREGLGWYVKLNEGEDGAMVVSHHGPEGPATTIANVTILEVQPGATTETE